MCEWERKKEHNSASVDVIGNYKKWLRTLETDQQVVFYHQRLGNSV